jgi:CRP-like cAMP-binding protein
MISPERLRKQHHFAGVPDSLLKSVAMLAQERPFRKGEVIFAEGQPAQHLIFLEAGEIDIVFTLGSGHRTVVDTLVTGDLAAWSALIPPYTLTAQGVARSDGTLIDIEAVGLRRVCSENPGFGYSLMIQVARTLRERLSATRVQLAAALHVDPA